MDKVEVVLPYDGDALAYLGEVQALAEGGLDDGKLDEAGGCRHTWLDRDLRVRHNAVEEEDMDSLVEDHGVVAVRTSNPYVEVEDRIDSIRFLPDSEEDRLVNMAVVRDPSMDLHHQGHCHRIQEVGVMVDDRHSSMHLRAMKLVL